MSNYGRPGMIGLDSGGGAAVSVASWWNPLLPQDPAHAKTTIFPGTSLPSGYAELDNDSNTVVTVADGEVQIVHASTAGESMAGIYVATPTDNQFSVTAEIRLSALSAFIASGYIFVGEDMAANPTTAAFVTTGMSTRNSPTNQVDFSKWTDYNNSNGSVSGYQAYVPLTRYFARFFVDRTATTVTALIGSTGRGWAQIAAAQTWAAMGISDVDSTGILMDNRTGQDSTVRSSLVRFDISSDPFIACGGLVGSIAA